MWTTTSRGPRRARYRNTTAAMAFEPRLIRRGLMDVPDIPYRELRQYQFVSHVGLANSISVGLVESAKNFMSINRLLGESKQIRLKDMMIRFYGYKTTFEVALMTPEDDIRTVVVCKSHVFVASGNRYIKTKNLEPGTLLLSDVPDRVFKVISVTRKAYEPVAEVSTSFSAAHYSVGGVLSTNINGHRKYLTIQSFGLMIFRDHPVTMEPELLMVRCRYSMAALDLIRARLYNQPPSITEVFASEITQTERDMLVTLGFRELWTKLECGLPDDGTQSSLSKPSVYMKAERKFHEFNVKAVVEATPTIYTEPEIGIPKGRVSAHETTLQCAKREVQEETGFDASSYDILSRDPIYESFVATNGVSYKHTYWIARLKDGNVPDLQKQTDYEIDYSIWATKDKALAMLRSYDTAKKDVIVEGFDMYSHLKSSAIEN